MRFRPIRIFFFLLSAVVILAIIFIAGFAGFNIYVNNKLKEAEAKFQPSEAWARYEEWLKESKNPTPAVPLPASLDAFAKTRAMFEKEAGRGSEWAEFYSDNIRQEEPWYESDRYEYARGLCERSQDLITAIRDLAAMGGPFILFDLSKNHVMDTSHVTIIKGILEPGMIQILVVDTICKSRDGAYDAALDDILSIMKLGDALAMEPNLFSQIVRINGYNTALDTIHTAFPMGVLNPARTARIIDHIHNAPKRHDTVEAIRGEMMKVMHEYDFLRNELQVDRQVKNKTLLSTPYRAFLEARNRLARPWMKAEETTLISWLDKLIIQAEKPYYESVGEISRLKKIGEPFNRATLFAQGLFKYASETPEAQARYETYLGLIETGLLVEQQIAQTGSAPDSIAFVGAAVTDPFTGEPFEYHPDGATFTLYSLGPDMDDDGGAKLRWHVNHMNGDISWRGK